MIGKMWYVCVYINVCVCVCVCVCIHSMEYYLAIKRNEVQINATAWKSTENLALSERSQAKRMHIILFHLYEISRRGTSAKTESRLVAARGWAKGVKGRDCSWLQRVLGGWGKYPTIRLWWRLYNSVNVINTTLRQWISWHVTRTSKKSF